MTSSMSCAAAIPVSREIWAFHSSAGTASRRTRRQPRAVLLDLLLGDGQVHRAAGKTALDEEPADVGQESDGTVEGARVRGRLDPVVIELGPAADHRTLHPNRAGRAVGVEVDGPEHGRTESPRAAGWPPPRRATPGAVAPSRRAGRPSDRDARSRPRARRRRHERRDVGDRVEDSEAASAPAEADRLVEVA